MSKKITHENIKKVVSRTYNALVYYFNDDDALKFEREIQDYIKQQEKQDNYTINLIDIAQHRLEQISLLETKLSKKDELLELHKKLVYYYGIDEFFNKFTNIQLKELYKKQIKELEK